MTAPEPDLQAAKEDLFAQCRRGGAVVVGVADATAFTDAPEGFRPGDVLPNARAVLVLGGAAPRAGDWLSPKAEHMETVGTSDRITVTGSKVARYIEDKYGYYALTVPPGTDKGDRPFVSITLAAELAGCGSRTLAGPIMNPDYGLLYYAAILTTLPLPPDEPLVTPACPAPPCVEMWAQSGTTPCLSVCPMSAGGCLDGRLVDGRIAERRYDKERCTTRVYNYWIPGYQQALVAALEEDDSDARKMILYSSFFTRTLWSITYSNVSQGQCFECVRVCPIGMESRIKQ